MELQGFSEFVMLIIAAMTGQTKYIRFGFTNARSGSVDFTRALGVISERCQNLRYLDLTFATDTLLQTKPGNRVFCLLFGEEFPSTRCGDG